MEKRYSCPQTVLKQLDVPIQKGKKKKISTHTSKWITDLNIKDKTVKLLEENSEKIFLISGEQRVLRYNNVKSTIRKKKKFMN